MKTNTNIPNSLFFDFSKNLKQLRLEVQSPKTLLKTCFKLWGNSNFSLVKTLAKIPKNWGLYRPYPETSR